MKWLQTALLAFALVTVLLPMAKADFYTEQFTGTEDPFDLDYQRLTFTPTGSSDLTQFYTVTLDTITQFATDPTGGTVLNFSDDSAIEVTLGAGHAVKLFGQSYSSFWVGSNGYLNFSYADDRYAESLDWHFDSPRVSCIFDDFGDRNYEYPGTVSWKVNQLDDRVAFTYEDVEEYGLGGSNTYQIEMFFNGTIAFSYLGITSKDSIVGLSAGDAMALQTNGIPENFVESNFSDAPAAVPLPGSLLLCGIGLISIGARRRLMRKIRRT